MRLESAVYISRPPGSWMDPSNWNSKYPTPIPHTQQVYIYISSPLGSWMDPSNWNSKYSTQIPHTQQVLSWKLYKFTIRSV